MLALDYSPSGQSKIEKCSPDEALAEKRTTGDFLGFLLMLLANIFPTLQRDVYLTRYH
jgi:hypothetical protein